MELSAPALRRVFADGHTEIATFPLLSEKTLTICLDGKPVCTLTCTDTFRDALAVGYLASAGLLQDRRIRQLRQTEDCVFAETEAAVSSAVLPAAVSPEVIFRLAHAFRQDSQLRRKTQGLHGCYLAYEGDPVFHAQDLSRRNALYKAMGYALLQGLLPHRCVFFSTGRVASDMVQAMLHAGFSALAAKGVATWQAVQLAKKTGFRLICRAWPDSYDDYG